jgi:membrane protein required for colicin V production
MTGFDIAVLLTVGAGAVMGFARGFVNETLALLAWVFSLFAIRYLHAPLTDYFFPKVGTWSGAAVLAFALLLLIPYAVVKLTANWLGARTRASLLGPIDRVLGFGFGGVKAIVFVVLAFTVLMLGFDVTWGPTGRPTWITQSRTYPFINASSDALVTTLAERRQQAERAGTKVRGA